MIFIFLAGTHAYGVQIRCGGLFSSKELIKSENIGFTQDVLGLEWGRIKSHKIILEFQSWTRKLGIKTKQLTDTHRRSFITNYFTTNKSFPVIYDVHGQPRIIDRHHDFWALSHIMHGLDFSLRVEVKKDYRAPKENGAYWTKEDMVADMVERGWLSLEGVEKPNSKDFDNLPGNINHLKNSPLRSVLSMAMASIKVSYKTRFGNNASYTLKGSDFNPMVQLLLARRFSSRDTSKILELDTIEAVLYAKQVILNSPQILQFLLDNVLSSRENLRSQRIREFLRAQLLLSK